jgi:hypothetical protein
MLVETLDKGRYTIEFKTFEGEEIGFARLSAYKPDPHPWQQLDFEYEDEGVVLANHPNAYAACPSIGGFWPIINPADLPRVPFGDDDPESRVFDLSLNGDSLVLKFPAPVTYSAYNFNFIGRWWVNGRPIVSPLCQTGFGRINGHMWEKDCIEFRLRVDGKKLGASPGDTIGLQLMYTPWEWEPVGLMPFFGHHWKTYRILVSNRVEFTYEGD